MTLLVAGVALLLSGVAGVGLSMVGRAATTDARAQIAADAAALAAVAESAPHGAGQPEVAATRYALANGAELVRCGCAVGNAVQVQVAIEDVTAEARAVLDPDLIRSGAAGSTVGLHPSVAAAVDTLLREARGQVHVVSGYRGSDEQSKLWAEALSVYGTAEEADDWVARPGGSLHEAGLAVDLGGDLALADRLVRSLRLPLFRPLPQEPWHYELVGSRG